MRGLLEEIKRRNVFKVAFVYVIAGWLTMQIADVMFPALKLPEWMVSAVAAMVLIGFPFAIIFAWAFEMTPEGIKREKDVDRSQSITGQTGSRLNRSAMIILMIAVSFLLADKFLLRSDPVPNVGPDSEAQLAGELEISATEKKPSIAVLPFVNMSADAENEYFSDGLSEELLNVLAKIPQLHVAGRTSSFAFKGKDDDLRTIGEKLNVRHILEGSVRKSNTRLRITAQLIDTDSGYHVWSQTYDRELTDVFAIQDEIAVAVVEALKVALLGDAVSTNHGTDSLQAYELYLQARYFYSRFNETNLAKALAALEAAIAIDPEFAKAYALMADVYTAHVSGYVSAGQDFIAGFQVVKQYAKRAMELDDKLAEAYVASGVAAVQADWDFDTAVARLEQALDLEPGNVDALDWLSTIHMSFGRFDIARLLLEKALEIDPLAMNVQRNLAYLYFFSGDFDKAIELSKQQLEIDAHLARVNADIGFSLLHKGEYEQAAIYFPKEPVEWVREQGEVLLLIKTGPESVWRSAAVAYAAKWGERNSVQMAEIYAWGGDSDQAFRWLETARDVRDPGNLWSGVYPTLASLRDDPRWPEHLRESGLLE